MRSLGLDLDSLSSCDDGKGTHTFPENVSWEWCYILSVTGLLPSDAFQGLAGACAEVVPGHRQSGPLLGTGRTTGQLSRVTSSLPCL